MGTGTGSERERTPSLQPPRIINGGNRGKGWDRAGIVTTGRPSSPGDMGRLTVEHPEMRHPDTLG
uniref:Uncharacterized protein n=1 Tax=Coccidioides posadasii RMSCC 3488 TaxID=454284 RepID=A0A0J6FJ61_COCPO|nr:hypothetical protein CPAG_05203 [Coccidioides posadasii RMSCC 3488]